MKKTLPNGDIITEETIADKIRRIAKHPSVIRNRRLLKAMFHVASREENAKICFHQGATEVCGRVNPVTTINALLYVDGPFILGDPIVMFPLNSFDPNTGEPPTVKE